MSLFEKWIKRWFEISEDELQHRQDLVEKYRDEPLRIATLTLEKALETVMKRLGVDVTGNIPAQQAQLGIVIGEISQEDLAGINGFYVNVHNAPYAYVGQAKLDSLGRVHVEIHWFKENKMDEVGGYKIIH